MIREAPKKTPMSATGPRARISYIHGGSVSDKYRSRRQMRRLLHARFVRERMSVVQRTFTNKSV